MDGAGDRPAITFLGGVRPLVDARSPEDDWTGITSTAERKKRQNRLNQRAHRRRKLAQQKLAQAQSPGDSGPKLPTPETSPSATVSSALTRPNTRSPTPPGEDGGSFLYSSGERAARFRAVLRRVYEDYILGGPRPTDLHVVIRINVMNAMFHNARALGFPTQGICAEEYISPFNMHGPHAPEAASLPRASCPESLRPTDVQRRYPHHPWIDLLPFPRFRDNVLLAVEAGLLDEDELCVDVVETEAVWGHEESKPALIVWGKASDSGGWEVNPAFVRRWGWLLRGCSDIVAATNYWRERRGENRIVFDPR